MITASDPAPSHDHTSCIATALDAADRLCLMRGARLTDIRRRVLALVWLSHQPRGAYAILDDLSRGGKRAAPLTVYRALDFLVEQGLVHRLESLNAYVGCPAPGVVHAGQFLVCDTCGGITECDDPALSEAIIASASERNFTVTHPTIEVHGQCQSCRPH